MTGFVQPVRFGAVLAPTPAERRYWQRVERRTIAAYERDLLDHVRGVALGAPTAVLTARPGDGAVGELHLTIDDTALVLQEVSMSAVPADPLARLTDVGRYGPRWWVRLDTGGRSLSILAAGLACRPWGPSGPTGPHATVAPAVASVAGQPAAAPARRPLRRYSYAGAHRR